MNGCLVADVVHDANEFMGTTLRLYTGSEWNPKDVATVKRIIERIVGLSVRYLTNLLKQIARWRSEVAQGKVRYEEHDERAVLYVLTRMPGWHSGPPWDNLMMIAQSDGLPIRGLEEMNRLIEDSRKMLETWMSPTVATIDSTVRFIQDNYDELFRRLAE